LHFHPNPFFYHSPCRQRFLDSIAPLKEVMGPILMQFEYLNRHKMPSQKLFQEKLAAFKNSIADNPLVGIEVRNNNYLNDNFLHF
jgi:uncharacterized protein YecE (DUF72 family)